MQKAYDRVEWDFLAAILARMGFHAKWVNLVMQCVTTVSFSIKLNGEELPYFLPSRGIRQGDPLSPYLFILVTNVLSMMFKQALQQGIIKGIKLSRQCPTLTYLLFADDSIFFLDGTRKECQNVAEILGRYCYASGQAINLNKSGLFFSKNCPENLRQNMLYEMRVPELVKTGKYLGIPSDWGASRKEMFAWLTARVNSKLEGWKETQLSRAGKDVLIKAVVQAIPQYAMSIFKIPLSICRAIEKRIANFWWKTNEQRRGLHWKKWEVLKTRKDNGGLGFRDLITFNKAMLGKQAWRLLQSPTTLWGQIFKGLYFPHTELEHAQKGSRPSWGWQSLLAGRDAIMDSTRWVVGNGEKIKIREQRWLSQGVLGGPANRDDPQTVAELISEQGPTWNEQLISHLFDDCTAMEITTIPLSQNPTADRIVWTKTRDGVYSVKSGYNTIRETGTTMTSSAATSSYQIPRALWSKVWGAQTWPKIIFFLWGACQNAIPTKENLLKRGIVQNNTCELCNQHPETVEHLLLLCPWTQHLWTDPAIKITVSPAGLRRLDKWLLEFTHPFISFDLLAMLLWQIWTARNNFLFRKLKPNPRRTIDLAVAEHACCMNQAKFAANKHTGYPSRIWKGPPNCALKVNIDGAFSVENLDGAISCVCRNSKGELVDGFAKRIRACSAEQTETSALVEALKFLCARPNQEIHVESDCQALIKTLRGEVSCAWEFEALTHEAKSLLMGFRNLSLAYCSRESNGVADWLAKSCLDRSLPCNWLASPPATLRALLILDASRCNIPPSNQ